jgi:hypothetical protein
VPTGIDYLGLVEARHSEEIAKRIVYTDLPGPDGAGPSEEDMDGIVITRPASWDLVTDRPIETQEGQP